MTDIRTFAHPAANWTLFANNTIISTTSAGVFTILESLSSSNLRTTTVSSIPSSPTALDSASSSPSLSSAYLSTLAPLQTNSLDFVTSNPSSVSSLGVESVLNLPLIPIPVSLSSSMTGSLTSAAISSTPKPLPTGKSSSFLSQVTASIATKLTPASESSRIASTRQSSPSESLTNPTSTPPPSFSDGQRSPPVLLIIAIVVSVVAFILVLSLLLLRHLAIRKRRPSQIAMAQDVSSSHSIATTYHSAHRGEVRIIIERPVIEWPMPPGYPKLYQSSDGTIATEGGLGADSNQWSVASEDGSTSSPDLETGTGRGDWGGANGNAGIGRAY